MPTPQDLVGLTPQVPTTDYTSIFQQELAALTTEIQILSSSFSPGGSTSFIDVGTGVQTFPVLLYGNAKPVKKAVIQNLSTTDNYTVTSQGQATKLVVGAVAGTGIILNKAGASGQGGGSLSVNNIDLSMLTIMSDTNASQKVGIYYEI